MPIHSLVFDYYTSKQATQTQSVVGMRNLVDLRVLLLGVLYDVLVFVK